MNILIVDFDIVDARGGGQTAYAKLIAKSPGRTYYYFSRHVDVLTPRMNNTYIIPFRETYVGVDGPGSDLAPFYGRYVAACQYAESVKVAGGPTHFDVVDVPDYTTDAVFIRPALRRHGINVGVLALALHGTISHAFEGDWRPAAVSQSTLHEVYAFERSQFDLCDVRYALSKSYADLWYRTTGFESRAVDPLHIVGDFTAEALQRRVDDGRGKPDLVTIGRRERRKGPDLAVDLAFAVGTEHFCKLRIIGDESRGVTGTPSRPILERAATFRGVDLELSSSLPFENLEALFGARTIILLPSRIDSFNLVALEALRRGCPVFVSREAGVSRWIETNYPGLSDLVIDIDCGRLAAKTIRHAAQHYDEWRARISDEIARNPLVANSENLVCMYEPLDVGNVVLRQRFDRLAALFDRDHRPRRKANFVPVSAPPAITIDDPMPAADLGAPVVEAAEAADRAHHSAAIEAYGSKLRGMQGLLPVNEGEFRRFLSFFNESIGMHRSARIDVFDQMAAMERARQRPLTAALYDLRAMRWLDADKFGRLDEVKRIFRAEGFGMEADVAEAMYRDPRIAHECCAALIADRFRTLLKRPDRPFEFIDDRRGSAAPKVSVIVSLYNAASKLPTFMKNVSIQTLAHDGLVEIVLVDSGSPTNEYAVHKSLAADFAVPVVFARSRERETIQAAWNRGIGLARAPYLCFYGVDEGMHTDCLSRLARVLDEEPEVDWVMANSLVTDVDAAGIYAGDVMEYRRDGLDREMVYLDTCYLSWVGGLYRKSIHERFGYYDETFRAAGDTEFKCRILHFIKIKHIPQTLGIFNNYPEERTTAHPRAEIEDQRAWYLHRTSAGMANLFDDRDIDAAESFFTRCLAYRKSYCQHISTDFDLAAALVTYMERRGENPEFATSARACIAPVTAAATMIDAQSILMPVAERQAGLANAYDILAREAKNCSKLFRLQQKPWFGLFNDNRHEQHWWSWSQ